MMAKKVVLFIVEGLSDQNALNPIISEIIDESVIHFEVVHGDITSNYKVNSSSTIIKRIEGIINNFLIKRSFQVEDLLEVILLTDTDGTFINDDKIVYHNKDSLYYEDNKILTKYIENIKMRNHLKSSTLDKLAHLSKITIRNKVIPFNIFYMSCNLDHVLHNQRNMGRNKVEKAIAFADSYEGREYEFIDFLKQFMINIEDNYKESWEKIKEGNNSLLRYSNLWLFLEKYK